MDLKRSPGGYFCYSEYTILWGRPVGREREAPPRKSIQFTKKSQLGRLGQKTAATGQGAVVWASLGQSDQDCASSVADHCCSCVSLNTRVSVVFSVLSILSHGRPSVVLHPNLSVKVLSSGGKKGMSETSIRGKEAYCSSSLCLWHSSGVFS